jgi:hypothetical protein
MFVYTCQMKAWLVVGGSGRWCFEPNIALRAGLCLSATRGRVQRCSITQTGKTNESQSSVVKKTVSMKKSQCGTQHAGTVERASSHVRTAVCLCAAVLRAALPSDRGRRNHATTPPRPAVQLCVNCSFLTPQATTPSAPSARIRVTIRACTTVQIQKSIQSLPALVPRDTACICSRWPSLQHSSRTDSARGRQWQANSGDQ